VPGVDAVFAALSDPTRREVIRSLAERPGLTASLLAGELPVTRQAVSKHLAALSDAGLVQARREGRETRYTLTPAPLAGAMEWMVEVGAEWDVRLERLAVTADTEVRRRNQSVGRTKTRANPSQ
jgi:ArsR family transcriptional regulator, cadmium/lead-responsive transcriptional repressor